MMANSIDEKFYLIERIADVETLDMMGQPTGLLAHSVLNSISLTELIRVFHHEAIESKWVSGNISRRLPSESNRDALYDYLFDALKDSVYINRLRLRKPMDAVISHLNDTQQMEYFSYFFRSPYLYERKAAAKLAESFWNHPDIQSLFLERYEQHQEIFVLATLLKKLEIDLLTNLLEKVYHLLPRFLKGIVMSRLKGTSMKDLNFILKNDPSNYLRLATFSKEPIDDEMAMGCYERISEQQRPFALYNLGLLDKWSMVKAEIEKYLEKPNDAFPGFGDLLFEH